MSVTVDDLKSKIAVVEKDIKSATDMKARVLSEYLDYLKHELQQLEDGQKSQEV